MLMQIVEQRYDGDCGTVALAMLLTLPYEDVAIVMANIDKAKGRKGVWQSQILRAAEALGFPLRRKKKFEFDRDEGILWLSHRRKRIAHVVVVRRGLIFDTDRTVWEPETYKTKYHDWKATFLFVDPRESI